MELNNVNINNIENKKKHRKKYKNTTNFKPEHKPLDMYVRIFNRDQIFNMTTNNVIIIPSFCKNADNIYENLLAEMQNTNINKLWKNWHENSHKIADDSLNWKQSAPLFSSIVEELSTYLNMKVNSTRFNWYTDTSEWKPYHHDAAAIKPYIAKKQNVTVAISFGANRIASFQKTESFTTIGFELDNNSVYIFGNDVNKNWKHGILQELNIRQEGRISIILWGWINQIEQTF